MDHDILKFPMIFLLHLSSSLVTYRVMLTPQKILWFVTHRNEFVPQHNREFFVQSCPLDIKHIFLKGTLLDYCHKDKLPCGT